MKEKSTMTIPIVDGYGYDLIDRIKDGQYDPKEPPERPAKPYLKQGHNSKDASQYASALSHHEVLMAKYKQDMNVYAKDKQLLFQQFKRDAINYCGLSDHLKAEKAFEYAWNGCRDSGGMVQIVEYLEELSELMIK
jgi:hypothetical protein